MWLLIIPGILLGISIICWLDSPKPDAITRRRQQNLTHGHRALDDFAAGRDMRGIVRRTPPHLREGVADDLDLTAERYRAAVRKQNDEDTGKHRRQDDWML